MQIDYTKIWYQGCGEKVEGTEKEKYAALEEMERSGNYYAQPKCDGIWSIIFGVKDDFPMYIEWNKILSRNALEKTEYELPFVGKGNGIVGELGYGSQHSLARKAKYGYNFMDVFEILFYQGKYVGDSSEQKRRFWLRQWHDNLPEDNKKHFKILPLWFSRFVERYKKQPEGLIIKKRFNGAYIPGTKSKLWIKCKKEYDWDMVLMDFELSTATTKVGEPMVKNLIFGQYVNSVLKKMTKVGALDNDMSRKIAQDFKKYKGMVGVVHGYCQFDSGGIRHPSFGGFRDDKDAKDCIFK